MLSQRTRSILQHAGIFEKAKNGIKPFFNFFEKGSFPNKPSNTFLTTNGATKQTLVFLGQEKGNDKIKNLAAAMHIAKQVKIAKNFWQNTSR